MGQAHEQRFVKQLIAQSTGAGSHRMSQIGPSFACPVGGRERQKMPFSSAMFRSVRADEAAVRAIDRAVQNLPSVHHAIPVHH